jgi:hypothetical protein
MNSLTRTTIATLVALVSLQATAEAQSGTRRPRDRNVLTAEEIRTASVSTVHELLRSKRPRWLSVRGSSTLRTVAGKDIMGKPTVFPAEAEIAVYFDGVKAGSQEILRTMSTNAVESIEYLDAASATQRFGTNHEHGAILIRRRVH